MLKQKQSKNVTNLVNNLNKNYVLKNTGTAKNV